MTSNKNFKLSEIKELKLEEHEEIEQENIKDEIAANFSHIVDSTQ